MEMHARNILPRVSVFQKWEQKHQFPSACAHVTSLINKYHKFILRKTNGIPFFPFESEKSPFHRHPNVFARE